MASSAVLQTKGKNRLITVEGDQEVIASLTKLGDAKTVKKYTTKAMRIAQKELALPWVKSQVPVLTGAGRRSVKIRSSKRSRLFYGVNLIFLNSIAYYMRFLNDGTKNKDGSQRIKAEDWIGEVYRLKGKQMQDRTLQIIEEEIDKIWEE